MANNLTVSDPSLPLLTSTSVEISDKKYGVSDNSYAYERSVVLIKPKRKIIVEPILAIIAAVGVPYLMALSLYIYKEFEYEAMQVYKINISSFIDGPACHGGNASVEFLLVTEYSQNMNSLFFIAAGLIAGIPCIIVSIILGPYSDQAGRRYAIIVPLVATAISTSMALVIVFFRLNIWLLLIALFIEGLGGAVNVLLLGCFAYIVDITEPQNLQFRLTVVELIMIIPASLTPIGIGYFIADIGYSSTVFVALIGTLIALIYAIFFVPETIKRSSDAEVLTLRHIKDIKNLFTVDTDCKRSIKLRWIYIAFIPVMTVTVGNNLTILFLKNVPFCWDSIQVGIYLAVYFAFSGIGGVVFAKVLKKCMDDHGLVLLSGTTAAIRYIYHAIVWNTISVYFIPPLSVFGLLYSPSMRTIMSQLVGPREQGAVFSALAISQIVCGFFGNILFTAIYGGTNSVMSGFVYLVMALFFIVGTCIFLVYFIRIRKIGKIA